MNILIILGGLQIALIVTWGLCAKSFRDMGRRRGIEEAVRELLKGIASHYETNNQDVPEQVAKAIKTMNGLPGKPERQKPGAADPHHAQLWIIGNAMGEACWLKGHTAGIRRKLPAEGKIRVDLSLPELLQLSWLAHLGFRYMMPNYRGFDIHRFGGEDDAREGSRAVTRLEGAIPSAARPFGDILNQVESREKLIGDWWREAPARMMA